jgi:hypothetical protein
LYSLPLKTRRTLPVNLSRYQGEDEKNQRQTENDHGLVAAGTL